MFETNRFGKLIALALAVAWVPALLSVILIDAWSGGWSTVDWSKLGLMTVLIAGVIYFTLVRSR